MWPVPSRNMPDPNIGMLFGSPNAILRAILNYFVVIADREELNEVLVFKRKVLNGMIDINEQVRVCNVARTRVDDI